MTAEDAKAEAWLREFAEREDADAILLSHEARMLVRVIDGARAEADRWQRRVKLLEARAAKARSA